MKTPPAYLNCTGGEFDNSECSRYAKVCLESEVDAKATLQFHIMGPWLLEVFRARITAPVSVLPTEPINRQIISLRPRSFPCILLPKQPSSVMRPRLVARNY